MTPQHEPKEAPSTTVWPDDLYLIGCSGVAAQPATPSTMGFKAYNLQRMADLGLPVPPAFVLGTRYCLSNTTGSNVNTAWPHGLAALEATTRRRLGDRRSPLLLSVRSGAPVSMPGMMETLLNIGLCDATLPGLMRQTGNPRLVWDAYRRLVACYGEVVCGVPAAAFEAAAQESFGKRNERDLDFAELRELTQIYLNVFRREAGRAFPQAPKQQLQEAMNAVFASWQSDKAREYRHLNHIDDSIGTAVTVQSMVFGNGGGACGAGVGFTRNPATGEPGLWVDFLFNAQGEDVVSGRRSAQGHEQLAQVLPAVWAELERAARTLERAFGDMQDIEFTVQNSRLFMLQTRSGKRTPMAAARIALDMLDEGLITRAVARERTAIIKPASLTITHVLSGSGQDKKPLAHAASACSGVAVGEIAFDAERAHARQAQGAAVILVRRDAETSDLAALEPAIGLLTQHGARTSHAAVVARQMGKVCLVGCEAMQLDEATRSLSLAGQLLHEGDVITLDGNTGSVYQGAVRTVEQEPVELLARLRALAQT